MSINSIPSDIKSSRACLGCSLIKSFDQFLLDGCENCDEYLLMRNNRDRVQECTSSTFEGMIALMSPEESWIAKWQKISTFEKGIYAVSVSGRLPSSFVKELKSRGIQYRHRDRSFK